MIIKNVHPLYWNSAHQPKSEAHIANKRMTTGQHKNVLNEVKWWISWKFLRKRLKELRSKIRACFHLSLSHVVWFYRSTKSSAVQCIAHNCHTHHVGEWNAWMNKWINNYTVPARLWIWGLWHLQLFKADYHSRDEDLYKKAHAFCKLQKERKKKEACIQERRKSEGTITRWSLNFPAC